MNEAASSKRLELLEVLTVGLPFCGFKILTGLSLADSPASAPLMIAGFALVSLGALDGLLNAVNLAGLLVNGRRPMTECSFAFAARTLRGPSGAPHQWQDLGNSADVLVSFALVALMIGFARLRSMPPGRLAVWNACVILNVLGAGLGRFGLSLRDLSRGR
jgi:hypothetical protein